MIDERPSENTIIREFICFRIGPWNPNLVPLESELEA